MARAARVRKGRSRKPARTAPALRLPLHSDPFDPMTLPTTLAAAGLGWTAGMRSMTAPAALAHVLADGLRPRRQPARFLGSDRVARLLALAASGELVGDKLPITPARTSALPLGGRIGSGALVGAAVAAARRESVWFPALVGAAAAVASSYAMMGVRTSLPERLGVPDFPVALAEDVAAVALGVTVARAV